MKTSRQTRAFRPLSISLARFTSSVAVASALTLAAQGAVTWEGSAVIGVPGDGFLWTNPANWQADILPLPADDVIFADPGATAGNIVLNGDKTVNSIRFTANNFSLGAYGTSNVLTNSSGLITVDAGNFATLNAAYDSNSGLLLDGGGTLFLNHPMPRFGGNIIVDGTIAGTTLLHRQEGPTNQYNALGGAQEFGRFDQVTLGVSTAVKTITLTNGGTYKIINAGNNSEGNFKNIVIGAGGGTLNLGAGYIVQSLDDTGQIGSTTEAFTLAGKGRLILGNGGGLSTTNPLGGVVNINGGMLSLDTQASQTVGANTYVRFLGIAGTGTTLNVNAGGTAFFNSGTQATIDTPVINLNNGSILGINGADHIIGYATATASSASVLNITGTATLLSRELFNPQQERLPRLRTSLTGSGTLELRPNTNSGGNPRVVIERNTDLTGFTGTFRLMENQALESIPRFNLNTGFSTNNSGRMIGFGDIEFAGWNTRFDVRENSGTAGNPGVLDYTQNDLRLTSTQSGAVATLAVNLGDGAALATGQMFHFGTLSMSNQRFVVQGNNSFQAGISNTAAISGNAVIVMNTDNVPLVFSNAAAISEDAAGRSLTLFKAGGGTAAQRDVIVGGGISLSNLEVATGTLQLRGVAGAINAAFGGSAPVITVNGGLAGTNGLPTPGVLHLDSNTGHVVGASTVIAAGENLNRIVDSATLNMRSNSTLRLTSANGSGTTETIGVTNVTGHATFDIVKSGVPLLNPVALTLTAFNMAGTKPTANFTGTSLGVAGNDSSRIVINPGATPTGFMGAEFHSGNEWAKYDNTMDSGAELGVQPFAAGDYTIDASATDAAWAPGQQLKLTSVAAPGVVMTGNRNVNRINAQFATVANQAIDLAGFVLTADQGGLLVAAGAGGGTTGIIDGVTGTAPSGTAGLTSATPQLYVHTQSQLDLRAPVTGGIDFVKSGSATMRLTHQNFGVGATSSGAPFTALTWSSTLTGNWIINDGRLEAHRGQFLGGRPVILNGGHLEINEPVSTANANTIVPNWGNNITINGNASVVADNNGEAATVGTNTAMLLGSLTINNGALFGHGAFDDMDLAYMGGATIAGTPTFNATRGNTNSSTIINGVLAGSGFNSVGLNGNSASIVLGGGSPDIASNTYNGAITLYAGTLRLNKANTYTAVTDGAATEDIVINGGAVVWGPGQHGDLSTTNNINLTNNGLIGRAPTSPAAVLDAGADQIADTADITLLAGTLGEGDRINNETFGDLIQKNGTFNVGLGTITTNSATISGGAFGIDRSGAFNTLALTLLPGAPDLNITTGIPAGTQTSLQVGSGGLSMSGQNIILGTGSSGNVLGSGAVLKLAGNVSVVGTDLIGGSYGRKGIFAQNGINRSTGASKVDLMGSARDFNIDSDVIFTVTAPLTNGSLSKSGGGNLTLQPYQPSTFAGGVLVTGGVLEVKGEGALGTGLVTVGGGATIKLDSGWTYSNAFQVLGAAAVIPGSGSVREEGTLIAEGGTSRLTGAFSLLTSTTIAGTTFLDPSVAPGAGGLAFRIGTLRIEGAGGVTGTGTLTLSGHGDGVIVNGVNTSSGGLNKDGAGRWTLAGAGSYVGSTVVSAGTLRISDGAALGSTAGGTSVFGGGALELTGGISVAEPMTLSGDGNSVQSGAVVNVGGVNTLTGAITLLGTTLRSDAGTLNVATSITGGATSLTLAGAGNGTVSGSITLGAPVSGNVLTKNGTGTWTLSGANALNGSTAVNGGILHLASAGSALHALSPLNMGGGSIINTGSAQTVNGLNLNAGGASIVSGAGLSVGIITRSAGATANFAGSVTAGGSSNTNGILGGYATVGNDWATVGGGSSVVALGGGSYVNLATATATDNAIRSAFLLASAPLGANSVKIGGGSGIDLGANNLVLSSGGLLYSSSVPGGITGTGTLSGATSSDELIVHVTGASLDIAAPIIGTGTGGLTKTGSGNLFLSAANTFTGPINVNGGTLSVIGAGGGVGSAANRPLNLNGGTFAVVGSDYDIGLNTLKITIGEAGGTLRSVFGATITLNDGQLGSEVAPYQFSGPGDVTFAGGGRFNFSGSNANFPLFTGKATVDGGILTLGNNNNTVLSPIGGRKEQTITLKPGSTIINNTGFGLGANGIVNDIVAEGGNEFFAANTNRVFGGDIHLSGTNTIALFERDNTATERQVYFNGRVTGTGITLNVLGSNVNNPFYLASGSNPITGTINLNPNAAMEVRSPGSLGIGTGDVTVNMATNSRLLLRHWQNADYRANVVVNGHADLNADRLTGFAGGLQQFLSINDLTVNGDHTILSFNGGSNYYVRVGGTTTLNGATNNILFPISADVIFENGITMGTPASAIDKRGGFSVITRGSSNLTGTLRLQQSLFIVQDAGAFPSVSNIELRGGELRVDNGSVAMADRLNDAAAISLGGGVLRITGQETLGTVTAASGTTQVIYNPTSEAVAQALTLTGFNRNVGSVVQFQAPDLGAGAVGAATFANARVSSRILIPGQADTTQTIPGFLGSNSLDFVQYDGSTVDAGQPLGVRDMRNPGSVNSPQNYSNDLGEGSWTDSIILRRTNGADNTVSTTTLTASRALDAMKIETGGTNRDITIALGANTLRIEGGGIIDVGATTHDTIFSGTGTLTAGPATPGAGTAELFLGGNNGSSTISAIVGNNGSQPVAVVKTGTGTWALNGANTFTGGLYVTSGTVNTTNALGYGTAPSTINLAGGTLLFNIAGGTAVDLGVPNHAVNVLANSQITLDNGSGGTDNDISLGALTIGGPYTLRLFSFDSMDASFTGTHTFTGTPTIDMMQAGSGGNGSGFFTINGNITGSGFFVSGSGNSNDTTSILQIGGGEATANTYSGKVTVLLGTGTNINNSEDLRVELNKAAGTTAITGDLEINGGTVRNIQADQIADTSNLVINQGQYDAFGKNETIASVTMRGGNFRTSSSGTGGSTVTVTGDFEITGADDLTGSGDGVAANSNTTLNILGTLKMNGYAKGTIGGTASSMLLGGLEMTGTTLLQNGAGSLIRLNGDVTTFASSNVARLGNTTTVGAQVQLNGTRAFHIADGVAGIDLSVSTALRDSTSPVAAGGLVKNGAGVMQLEGAATVNDYTGPTLVNAGSLVLYKNVGINALGNGGATNTLTIGDNAGGSRADQVIVRLSNQIADTTDVTIASTGLLDLDTFNTSETIGNLSGAAGGAITLGPTSTLVVTSTAATTFSGTIDGSGILTKAGAGALTLDGDLYAWTINATAGTLNLNTDGNNAVVNVTTSGTLVNVGVSQTLTALNIGDNTTVVLDAVGPAPAAVADDGFGAILADPVVAGFGGDASAVAVVPEPGSVALLALGALGLLGRRRRA